MRQARAAVSSHRCKLALHGLAAYLLNGMSRVNRGFVLQFLTDFKDKDKRGRGRMTHITMLTHPGKFQEIQRPLF